jgi:hypothetical protein
VSDQTAASDLLEITKLNGDFRKNYGTIIGAYLYLRSFKRGSWPIPFLEWFVFHGCNCWFELAAETWLVFSATASGRSRKLNGFPRAEIFHARLSQRFLRPAADRKAFSRWPGRHNHPPCAQCKCTQPPGRLHSRGDASCGRSGFPVFRTFHKLPPARQGLRPHTTPVAMRDTRLGPLANMLRTHSKSGRVLLNNLHEQQWTWITPRNDQRQRSGCAADRHV